jgi:putative SOS response-associated peptidase YedK
VSVIQLYQWGLIPHWIKDENAANRIRFRTLNARAETIHDKPAFRFSIKERRCLVIVDGFYEWRKVNKKKYPYYIKLVDNAAFAMAGIWDTWWNRKTEEVKNTFSIITTKANPLLERIHNTRKRMPVILSQEDHQRWLSTNLDRSDIDSLLIPFDDKQMDAYPVSRLITTRGTNTSVPGVLEKYNYEELED